MSDEEFYWKDCYTCRDYALVRREQIYIPLADKALREDRDVIEVVDEFMNKAHDRHIFTNEPLYVGGPTEIVDPNIMSMARTLGLFSVLKEFAESESKDPASR